MKKNVMALAVLFTACMQAMENDSNTWSITVGKTKINLTKGFIGDVDGKVDMIVVGKGQQSKLKPHFISCGASYVGELCFKEYRIVYKNSFEKKEVACGLVEITEPQIIKTVHDELLYDALRYSNNNNNNIIRVKEKAAVKEASKDLAICLKKVLSEVERKLSDKKEKSIALPALSFNTNFSQAITVVVRSIVEFIKNNVDAYDHMELCVEEDFEFDVYKELLEKSAAEK